MPDAVSTPTPQPVPAPVIPPAAIPNIPPQKKFPLIPVLLIVGVIFIAAVAIGAFFIYRSNQVPATLLPTPTTMPTASPTPSDSVSADTDPKTVQTELDNTNMGNFESDIQGLDSTASQL